LEECSPGRHVFKETNFTFRRGIAASCQCGKHELRMFAYQDIVRGKDPLILQEFEIRERKEENMLVVIISCQKCNTIIERIRDQTEVIIDSRDKLMQPCPYCGRVNFYEYRILEQSVSDKVEKEDKRDEH